MEPTNCCRMSFQLDDPDHAVLETVESPVVPPVGAAVGALAIYRIDADGDVGERVHALARVVDVTYLYPQRGSMSYGDGERMPIVELSCTLEHRPPVELRPVDG